MDFYNLTPNQPGNQPGVYRFDPWTAEIATTDYAALSIARGAYRVISFVIAGFEFLGDAIQKLRQACPVEVEPVKIAQPAQPKNVAESAERAAA